MHLLQLQLALSSLLLVWLIVRWQHPKAQISIGSVLLQIMQATRKTNSRAKKLAEQTKLWH